MAFSLADLNQITVESLISDVTKRLKEGFKPSDSETQPKIISKKRSSNNQAALYELESNEATVVATYKLRHRDSQEAILFKLYHLRKLYNSLTHSILEKSKSGYLSQAEILWKQQKNINLDCYTHRLNIIRVNNSQSLIWLLDINFSEESLHDNEIAQNVLTALLENLLEKQIDCQKSGEYLDAIVKEDWTDKFKEITKSFHSSHPIAIKVILNKTSHFI